MGDDMGEIGSAADRVVAVLSLLPTVACRLLWLV